MNKKITAVTLTALMVLTMFTAMVPAASAAKEVSAPYEFLGVTDAYNPAASAAIAYFDIIATSAVNPSLLYFDLDDEDGQETVTLKTGLGDGNLTIGDGNLTYTTVSWPDGTDTYIAWLGEKYYVIDSGSTWRISEKLVDEKTTDDYLLRVGESLTLPDGFSITALEIDVDGEEGWFQLSKDGEVLTDEVVTTDSLAANPYYFVFKEDLGGSTDTEVMNFTVETVFAGMNTNLVKINDIDLISMDVLVVKSSNDDVIDGYTTTNTATQIYLDNDDDITLNEDDITDILGGRFGVRLNDNETAGTATTAAIVQTIIVGGGAAPTPTEDLTVEPTVEPTETATGDGVATGTAIAAATAVQTEEVPTPEATKEPGFEAVFAVAGLLAVAYLVLRQRE